MNAGETEAENILEQVLVRWRQRPKKTFVVALDGHGGSGKTTLAGEIANASTLAHVPNKIIHMDDYYLPAQDYSLPVMDGGRFDLDRLIQEMLEPIEKGEYGIYRKFNWDTGELPAKGEPVSHAQLIILEGCYSSHPKLAPYRDMLVYVDTPSDICLKRLRERNENDDRLIRLWHDEELGYLRARRIAELADTTAANQY